MKKNALIFASLCALCLFTWQAQAENVEHPSFTIINVADNVPTGYEAIYLEGKLSYSTDENGKNYNVHVSNGSLLSKEVLVGDIPPGPGFREIVCVSRNCISSCDLILAGYMYDCTPCNPDPEAGNNYTCYKSDMSYCLTPAIADLMR